MILPTDDKRHPDVRYVLRDADTGEVLDGDVALWAFAKANGYLWGELEDWTLVFASGRSVTLGGGATPAVTLSQEARR